MLEIGIARPSSRSCSAALIMVPKKTGDWRPCGDYRAQKVITVPSRYPLPNIQDFTANLRGSTVFSKVKFTKAYHQTPIAEEDICKTVITTPLSLFEFTRMPLVQRNAAQSFQIFVDADTDVDTDADSLRGLPFVYAYVDGQLHARRTF